MFASLGQQGVRDILPKLGTENSLFSFKSDANSSLLILSNLKNINHLIALKDKK